jgi:hypothetical protein
MHVIDESHFAFLAVILPEYKQIDIGELTNDDPI